MCSLKSGIILKDRVFVPEYDSHTEMLNELGIEDTRANAERLFVRAELSPKDGDAFSDIDTWELNVGQDIIPEWFVADYEKERMIKAVKEWAKTHIFIGVDGLSISDKNNVYVKNCADFTCNNSTVMALENSTVMARENSTVIAWENSTVMALENSTVTARENSTVIAWENSTVTALENSTVMARENSTVMARENSTVIAWEDSTVMALENSTVTAWGNSTVIKPDFSSFNPEKLTLNDNSTFKDCKTKTIYQSGEWKFGTVKDGKVK